MKVCLACAVNEHEACAIVGCDGCAICNTVGRGPFSCGRCGNRFPTEDEAQTHADTCALPTLRVIA